MFRIQVPEYVFYGYLHGCWNSEGDEYWETETFKGANLAERWQYWMGWQIGTRKRRDIYG